MLTEPLPTTAAMCMELAMWGVRGAPVPPPPIVKQITLGSYIQGSQYRRFIETGTYLGHTTFLISSLDVEVDTIELSEMLHGRNVKDLAFVQNIRCHLGDSTDVLPSLLEGLNVPAVFWLDGHYSAGNTAMGPKVTPIMEELQLLRAHNIRDHIVFVDDIRGFGANGYPTVEWLIKIGREIVPRAEPRLINDSLILATAEQHAAAKAQIAPVAQRFIYDVAAPDVSLLAPSVERGDVAEDLGKSQQQNDVAHQDRGRSGDGDLPSMIGSEGTCEVRHKPFSPPAYVNGCQSQDEVIARIFEIIGVTTRSFVDAGIGDSWHDGLIHRSFWREGWKGVFIEHTSRSVDNLRTLIASGGEQANATVVQRRLDNSDVSAVVDDVIKEHFGAERLDLLGLRLRGPEWQALERLEHRPRVVGVLFNPSIPAVVEYVQEDGPNIHKGASLLALQILMQERGYLLVHVDRLAIFVDQEDAPKLGLTDHSLQSLWDGGTWQSRMLVAFDGTLVLAGNKRLLWNRIGEGKNVIDQEDLQVLFKNFRRLTW